MYDKPSVPQVKEIVKFIRRILKEAFVPLNLGINSINRNDITENHTTSIAKTLLGAEDHSVITIWDATYINIEKSANYGFQKDFGA